jgi:hypothetical protein
MDGVDEDTVERRPCVIEFQAFRGNNDKFIIKELVILDLLTFVVHPFMFEAPFSFNKLNSKAKTTNRWLSKHFHHIQWYEGYISYSNLHSIMFQFCKQYTDIYTRGLEKRNWIQRYTYGNVVSIEIDKDFKYQPTNCCITVENANHGETQCALRNAYRLAAYLEEYDICGGGRGDKYGGPTPPQNQCYTRLRRGNIPDHTTDEDGITTVSSNAS